ncbi:MAG: lysophospholipid acyltransferase family protein [Acidimicrobiales bacterium]|nr:lysophospholipid acyltransferase family protein [Acidimicrobiales bacterium]
MADPETRAVPLSRIQRLVYLVVRTVTVAAFKVYFRVETVGVRNLPPSGAYVVAPAHRSNLDALLVQAVTRRQLRLMGKDSLWKAGRFWAWFMTALGGFPVARGTADRLALRTAQQLLEQGEPLVLFPEGTRQSGPEIQPLFDGPAFLACRTGVPIIPVGIGGSEVAMGKGAKLPKPRKITLVFGAPLLPPERSGTGRATRREVQTLTATLHGQVQQVFDAAQRRVGQPVPSNHEA